MDFCVLHRGGRDGETHSSKKHKLLGAPAPIDTGAPVFARLPTDEHWLENVKLVKAHRDGEIPTPAIVPVAPAGWCEYMRSNRVNLAHIASVFPFLLI